MYQNLPQQNPYYNPYNNFMQAPQYQPRVPQAPVEAPPQQQSNANYLKGWPVTSLE